MKNKEKQNSTIEYDNLAVPEVHTGKADQHEDERQEEKEITFDMLAIPEIHIRHKEKK